MANVLTALAPILFSAARIVPRELTGILGAVTRDFDHKGVALGQTVVVPVAPILTASTVTPSATFASGNDRTATSKVLTLNNFKEVSWNLTAEQERGLMNGAPNDTEMLKQTIQQGIRTLVNAVELYTWQVGYQNSSRAFGTAGTTPFASSLSDLAQPRKIVVDNGASDNDLSCITDTVAGVNLRALPNLVQVYQAGADELLRSGVLGNVYKINIRESGQIAPVTKGTGTSYTSTTAGFAVGTTSIPLITGSGTVLAGDVVTFAGDTNKYVVATGVAAPGTIVLQEPGLKVALAASAVAMTIGNNYTANLLLHRSAVVAVIRPGLQPVSPVAEQMTITDEQTGLSFLLLRVVQNAQASWFMRIVYDAFAPNPYAIATLLG